MSGVCGGRPIPPLNGFGAKLGQWDGRSFIGIDVFVRPLLYVLDRYLTGKELAVGIEGDDGPLILVPVRHLDDRVERGLRVEGRENVERKADLFLRLVSPNDYLRQQLEWVIERPRLVRRMDPPTIRFSVETLTYLKSRLLSNNASLQCVVTCCSLRSRRPAGSVYMAAQPWSTGVNDCDWEEAGAYHSSS